MIVWDGKERKLKPMRYRVQSADGGEVPAKYNVFNARRDSLQSTWLPLFGHTHALFPFTRFYEWVERDGKKAEIYFAPKDRDIMWAASLYCLPNKLNSIYSFAMVTDDPPPEVAAAGHDRCPIFLSADQVSAWLNPQIHAKEKLIELLQKKENTIYLTDLAA